MKSPTGTQTSNAWVIRIGWIDLGSRRARCMSWAFSNSPLECCI